MARLNAKTAKSLRKAARELATQTNASFDVKYLEDTNSRKPMFFGEFDEKGQPKVYQGLGPHWVDRLCYKGIYKRLKSQYKKGIKV